MAAGVSPAAAGTIAVDPVRSINAGSAFGLLAIADDGTIYASGSNSIDVWSRSSTGIATVVKTFTGVDLTGVPALSPTGGLAAAYLSAVRVLDPAQAGGPAVFTRTISGVNTLIDDASDVAWTPEGSLWVVDVNVDGSLQLLRFAPGANGDVAPVQQIAGPKTYLDSDGSFGPGVAAGMPGNGVAVAAPSVEPVVSVFTSAQQGNVGPRRRFAVSTPGPHYLSQGIATDAKGRVYIPYGDLNGNRFGTLDVFAPNANGAVKPILSLGGTRQRFQIPVFPSVAPNGRLAVPDATVLQFGGPSTTTVRVKVFDSLFTKPGKAKNLEVATTGAKATVSWKAGTNPSHTPVTYRVVVKKGARTVVSQTVGATRMVLKRSSLPRGSLKVTVTSMNAGGASAGVTRAFTNN